MVRRKRWLWLDGRLGLLENSLCTAWLCCTLRSMVCDSTSRTRGVDDGS